MSENHQNRVCVIGLGYVGLPLAVAFAEKIPVVGFDIDQSRIDELTAGHDSTLEVDDDLLDQVRNNLSCTANIEEARECNIFIVTVPTPIDKTKRPDLSQLIKASRMVGSVIESGDIVIFESTVYPGVTEKECIPEIEKVSGLKFNREFFAGYSPERVNPGDKDHTIKKIRKVTSGSTPEIAQRVDALYQSIITAGTHLVSSIRVAEASKVIENTQRDVNIALINELALIFDKMEIDTLEVIEAAATKWNFIKLTPGLVGGHCIGVDPYYLTYKAGELGYKPNLILSARQINDGMGKYVAEQTLKKMIEAGKVIRDAKVLVLGLAFKENCPDMRNTRVTDIISELEDYEMEVEVFDPWVDPAAAEEHCGCRPIENPLENGKTYDAIIVAVRHEQFTKLSMNDYKKLSRDVPIIMDVKGIVPDPTWRL